MQDDALSVWNNDDDGVLLLLFTMSRYIAEAMEMMACRTEHEARRSWTESPGAIWM